MQIILMEKITNLGRRTGIGFVARAAPAGRPFWPQRKQWL